MKKLTATILIGMGLLMGGCGTNQQTVPQQTQTKVECGYTHGDFGSYTASNPVQLEAGKQFGFRGATFDSKRVGVTDDGKQKAFGLIIRNEQLCLYEIDVTGKKDWKELNNTNNTYVADEVTREKILLGDLVNEGIYPMEKVKDVSDLYKFVDVTIVKAHLVHTHTKECK